MVFLTGDTHAEFTRFSTDNFPKQKELTKDDYMIILGDFGGVWYDSNEERYWLDWLNNKPFTTLFVDGNHENFDRLYSEFEVMEFHGGKVHKIRDSVLHLMRGEIYNLCGKTFFAFGGAASHDVQDGILDELDYPSARDMIRDYNKRTKHGEMLRINHVSWWKEELPSEDEMENGRRNLAKHDNKVDYVITHCPPGKVCEYLGFTSEDIIEEYFDDLIRSGLDCEKWWSGHLHQNRYAIFERNCILYQKIVRLV